MHTEIIRTTTRDGYFGEKTVLAFVVSNSGREIIEDGARPADVDDAVLKFSAGAHRRAGSGCAREFDINFPKCISLLVLLVASDTLLPLAKRWLRLGMALLLRALRPDRDDDHELPAGIPHDHRIAQFGLRCVAAGFLEGVARPIGQVCDPHLHGHIVMSTVAKDADNTYLPVDFERAKRLLPAIQREVEQTDRKSVV